jgi:type IV pilus assembly protein PilA
MPRQRSFGGFTLIELMIVVAIIAILAAIAIPAYQNYLIRTEVSEGAVLSSGAKTGVWEYFVNTGSFPPNNLSAGLPATPTSISGNYVKSVTVTGGVITAAFGPGANPKIANTTAFVLSAVTHSGSISWTCTHSTVAPMYLPTSCRK